MKPELPFAMLFSFSWAKQGSAQLALCLETSPVNVTESFPCVGTRYYLRQPNPGWDFSAGVGLRGDWGCRERSWAEDCAHLQQLFHISLCGSRDLTGSVIATIIDHQRTASSWHSFFSTVSNLLCSSSAGTQLPKCPKQKRYTHFYTTWRSSAKKCAAAYSPAVLSTSASACQEHAAGGGHCLLCESSALFTAKHKILNCLLK